MKKHFILSITILTATTFFTNSIAQTNTKKLNKEGYVSYDLYGHFGIEGMYTLFNNLKEVSNAFKELKGEKVSPKDTVPASKEAMLKNLISYKKEMEQIANHENNPMYLYLNKTIKDIQSKGDSLISLDQKCSYYFFNDTVKVTQPIMSTIFIPKTFKKYTKAVVNGKTYKQLTNWEKRYKEWDTKYDIKIDRNDTKKILNIEGYKVVITEKRKDIIDDVYELYVSDNYNFPFLYYDFLTLKEDFNISGLILECKMYDASIPSLYNVYKLKEFNAKKQKHALIEVDYENYKVN
ncbi:hypothetical protein T190115A13A_30034 [Tenacibaculum sp. 190524A02b]|uniref:GLPGLI family protein n=1 Tax=Tenacibaculum vairaonense TaxID=3137860 RepID=A0ABP1FBS6_9FLAO